MSQGGRNLQDIYDAGIKRFEEVEGDIKSGIAGHTGASTELCEKRESTIMQRMEEALSTEQKNIQSYLTSAASSLEASIKAEMEENERFMARLEESVELTHRCLLQDIAQFKEFIEKMSDSKLSQESEVLRRESARLVDEVAALKTSCINSLQAAINQSQSNLADELSRTTETSMAEKVKSQEALLKIIADGKKGIDQAMSACDTALKEPFETGTQSLQAAQTDVQLKLQETANQGVIDVETQCASTQEKLKNRYERALAQAMEAQNSLAVTLTDDFQKGLESSKDNLSIKLTELQSTVTTLLDSVKQEISQSDFHVREVSGEYAEKYEQSLTEKLNLARENQDKLAEERRVLMENIKGDLSNIAQDYEQRLSNLSQQCLEKLSSICVDAELAITATHDNCAAEFREIAANQQTTIDTKTQAVLQRIEQITGSAVESIKAAAGEGGQQ